MQTIYFILDRRRCKRSKMSSRYLKTFSYDDGARQRSQEVISKIDKHF